MNEYGLYETDTSKDPLKTVTAEYYFGAVQKFMDHYTAVEIDSYHIKLLPSQADRIEAKLDEIFKLLKKI